MRIAIMCSLVFVTACADKTPKETEVVQGLVCQPSATLGFPNIDPLSNLTAFCNGEFEDYPCEDSANGNVPNCWAGVIVTAENGFGGTTPAQCLCPEGTQPPPQQPAQPPPPPPGRPPACPPFIGPNLGTWLPVKPNTVERPGGLVNNGTTTDVVACCNHSWPYGTTGQCAGQSNTVICPATADGIANCCRNNAPTPPLGLDIPVYSNMFLGRGCQGVSANSDNCTAYLCQRKTQFGGLADVPSNVSNVMHQWAMVRCGNQTWEFGLGPANGAIPGQQPTGEMFPNTAMINHCGQAYGQGSQCIALAGCNIDNILAQAGQNMGTFMGLNPDWNYNHCNQAAYDLLIKKGGCAMPAQPGFPFLGVGSTIPNIYTPPIGQTCQGTYRPPMPGVGHCTCTCSSNNQETDFGQTTQAACHANLGKPCGGYGEYSGCSW